MMIGMARTDAPEGVARSRWTLVGVVVGIGVLFVAPVLLAWVAFQTRNLWWSGATGNYGELITPARPVQLVGLQTYDREPLDWTSLRGRWTLVILATQPGDASCRQSLYTTRQVWAALERNQGRVQRLLVLEKLPVPAVRDELGRIDPDLIVTVAPGENLARIRRELAPGTGSAGEGSVYLVDPLGNLMMHYPAGADGKRMLKDLRRLLKVSQIG
jgi:cytochrome oxidase Cu insertion factor (SCO1/SenC/PrrC family)